MSEFLPPDVVERILHHMNDDHVQDNLTIARAHGFPSAIACKMVGFDAKHGTWRVALDMGRDQEFRVKWPKKLTDRQSVRQQIVAVYDDSRAKLGLPPRS